MVSAALNARMRGWSTERVTQRFMRVLRIMYDGKKDVNVVDDDGDEDDDSDGDKVASSSPQPSSPSSPSLSPLSSSSSSSSSLVRVPLKPVRVTFKRWEHDPFSAGAYAFLKVGGGPTTMQQFAAPVVPPSLLSSSSSSSSSSPSLSSPSSSLSSSLSSSSSSMHPSCARPTLYFAGEAAFADRCGMADGAYSSGLREAKRIVKSFRATRAATPQWRRSRL
jgi:hypothetical protein